jgi:hypothetical protein
MSITVPLESRRRERALLAQKMQHVLPSIFLLIDGIGRLGGEHTRWSLSLGAAEVVTSLLVAGAFARAVRKTLSSSNSVVDEHQQAHGVDWVDLFLAGMLVTEALVHRRETGHLPRPTVLLAAVVGVSGLLHGWLHKWGQRRRALRVTEEGISVSRRRRTRLKATWAELSRIELTAREALIVTRTGVERRIDLTDLKNPAPIVVALTAARERLNSYNTEAQTVERVPPA